MNAVIEFEKFAERNSVQNCFAILFGIPNERFELKKD